MNTLQSHIWRDNRFKNLLFLLCFIMVLFFVMPQPLSAQIKDELKADTKKATDIQSDNYKEYTKLVLTFTDVRSPSGNILVALYTNQNQWTDHPYKQLKFSKENLNNGSFTVEIDSLPQQTIAIALMDDENFNYKMEYLLGLPREGFGMSSNPSFLKLKKPTFSEVSFRLNTPVVHSSIKLNYLNPNKKIN